MKKSYLATVIISALSSASVFACVDTDGDLVCDALDSCVIISNPYQEDTNADGVGDACASPTADIHWEDVDNVKRWLIWAGNDSKIRNVTIYSPVIVEDGGQIVGRDDENALIGSASSPSQYNVYVGKGSRIYGGTVHTQNIGENSFIKEGSYVNRFVTIGDDVQIYQNVTVQQYTTIGDNTIIRRGSQLGTRIVIGKRVKIGRSNNIEPQPNGSYRNNIVIGPSTKIGDDVSISENVSIGEHSYIRPGSYIPAGTVIPPYTVYPSIN